MKRFLYFLFLIAVAFSCTEEGKENIITNPGVPAVTAVGVPIGLSVTKKIGASGGTIASADGIINLTIPPGALSADTQISVQPVTNEAPGGIGVSYDLLPNGTTFSKPATLTFHYTKEQVSVTHPYLLYVAHQTASQTWSTNRKEQRIDTVARTLSLDIGHFSIYTAGATIFAQSNSLSVSGKLKANETSTLTVVEVTPISDDEESLPDITPIDSELIKGWFINHQPVSETNGDDGTILGTGATVIYRAPSHIDQTRVVRVNARINVHEEITVDHTTISLPVVDPGTNITLQPDEEFNYQVNITYLDSVILTRKGAIYRDEVKFKIHLKFGQGKLSATISDVANSAPTVTPPTLVLADVGATWSWIADQYGEIDVIDSAVNSYQDIENDSLITIQLFHRHAMRAGIVEHFIPPSPPNPDIRLEPSRYNYPLGNPPTFQIDLTKDGEFLDTSNDPSFDNTHHALIVSILRI